MFWKIPKKKNNWYEICIGHIIQFILICHLLLYLTLTLPSFAHHNHLRKVWTYMFIKDRIIMFGDRFVRFRFAIFVFYIIPSICRKRKRNQKSEQRKTDVSCSFWISLSFVWSEGPALPLNNTAQENHRND